MTHTQHRHTLSWRIGHQGFLGCQTFEQKQDVIPAVHRSTFIPCDHRPTVNPRPGDQFAIVRTRDLRRDHKLQPLVFLLCFDRLAPRTWRTLHQHQSQTLAFDQFAYA